MLGELTKAITTYMTEEVRGKHFFHQMGELKKTSRASPAFD